MARCQTNDRTACLAYPDVHNLIFGHSECHKQTAYTVIADFCLVNAIDYQHNL